MPAQALRRVGLTGGKTNLQRTCAGRTVRDVPPRQRARREPSAGKLPNESRPRRGVRPSISVARTWVKSDEPIWCVAIGASGAEGLNDLRDLLAKLPATLPAAVLVVLHRSWTRPSQLQAVLGRATALPVVIAHQGEQLRQGRIYIGEPADHLRLASGRFGEIVADPEAQYRNRTIDLLFGSIAAHAGRHMIGVVLSGSLDDGAVGLAAIKSAGGQTMVVTPAQRSPDMPRNAINYDGPVNFIGKPEEIAAAICGIILAPAVRAY